MVIPDTQFLLTVIHRHIIANTLMWATTEDIILAGILAELDQDITTPDITMEDITMLGRRCENLNYNSDNIKNQKHT